MLLHGNLMCRRQFEDLIPLLEEEYCVYALRGSTAQERRNMEAPGGRLDLLFGGIARLRPGGVPKPGGQDLKEIPPEQL